MTHIKHLTLALAAIVAMAATTDAATISVVNADPFKVATPAGNPTTGTVAFDIGTTSDMLIVSTHADTYTLTSLTYGGETLSLVPGTGTGNNRVSGIYILDLQTTTLSGINNLIATYSVAGDEGKDVGFGVAAIASSDGNAIVVGDAGFATGFADDEPTLTLDVPEDDSFVFLAVGANGKNDGGTDMTTAGVTELDIPEITSMGAAAGYDLDVDAGNTPAYAWTTSNTGSTNAAAITGASFHVIPEPASLALVGLGSLLIVSRRRA